MTRRYGRALPGVRVANAVPRSPGSNVTILGALSCYDMSAMLTVEGPTDAAVFRTYVEWMLAPTLRPGDIVIMDNLSAHKMPGIGEAITAAGAKLIYLPPYPPDCSPIEECWSKIKAQIAPAEGPHSGSAGAGASKSTQHD